MLAAAAAVRLAETFVRATRATFSNGYKPFYRSKKSDWLTIYSECRVMSTFVRRMSAPQQARLLNSALNFEEMDDANLKGW